LQQIRITNCYSTNHGYCLDEQRLFHLRATIQTACASTIQLRGRAHSQTFSIANHLIIWKSRKDYLRSNARYFWPKRLRDPDYPSAMGKYLNPRFLPADRWVTLSAHRDFFVSATPCGHGHKSNEFNNQYGAQADTDARLRSTVTHCSFEMNLLVDINYRDLH
jgi:hypothetical protein